MGQTFIVGPKIAVRDLIARARDWLGQLIVSHSRLAVCNAASSRTSSRDLVQLPRIYIYIYPSEPYQGQALDQTHGGMICEQISNCLWRMCMSRCLLVGFISRQHLRSYQDKYRLMTVHTTGRPGRQHHDAISHTVTLS